jgi:hypothetical protein
LDLGDLSGDKYLGDLERDSRGDLEHILGERNRGDLERGDLLGDLDLCGGRGDLERDDNFGDLPLGDNLLSGDLFMAIRFGDLRGDGLGDLGLGEYRDNGDLLGDLYLDSLGDFFNCLIGDLRGDLRGDFLRGRDLGDNDLRF